MKWRLIAAFMAITLLVVLVQDIPLGNYLVRVERARLVTSLERDAFLLAGRSEDALEVGGAVTDAAVVADAKHYRDTSGARVVIVNAAGTAVVTSDDDQSTTGESYVSRPEIRAALSGEITSGQRHSVTLGMDLLYVTVPILSGGNVLGAVRLTYPAAVVMDEVNRQLRVLWIVAGTTVLLAGLVAFLMATTVTRRLQRLKRTTELLAEGDLGARTEENEGAPEIRALSRSFNRMAGRLETLLTQQKAFASDASHQLRTPLTALRLRLESASELVDSDRDAARNGIAAAQEEALRLQRIIEGLLLLSRTEGPGATAVETDLAGVARGRVEQWEPLAEESGVRITLESPPAAPVLAVAGAVEQIIDNFIDNALAVSESGSTILVTVETRTNTVELHVIDEGPGLSPEDCTRAFGRFWRARNDSAGSGLGLAIVDQLAQASGAVATLAPRATRTPGVGRGLDACVRFKAADSQ